MEVIKMKIISTRKYKEMNEKCSQVNNYRLETENVKKCRQADLDFYDDKLENIKDMLTDIINNKNMAKDKILLRINDVLKYIYKGVK